MVDSQQDNISTYKITINGKDTEEELQETAELN